MSTRPARATEQWYVRMGADDTEAVPPHGPLSRRAALAYAKACAADLVALRPKVATMRAAKQHGRTLAGYVVSYHGEDRVFILLAQPLTHTTGGAA